MPTETTKRKDFAAVDLKPDSKSEKLAKIYRGRSSVRNFIDFMGNQQNATCQIEEDCGKNHICNQILQILAVFRT